MIIDHLLNDLKIRHAELAEQPDPVHVEIHNSTLIVNKKVIPCAISNLECYQETIRLLSQIYNHYPNIIGDTLYRALNSRTNRNVYGDFLHTYPVMIRGWTTHSSPPIEAVHIAGDKFKVVVLTTGDQFSTALQFKGQSWEFFVNGAHCVDIGIFPYMMDMFSKSQVSDTKVVIHASSLLNKCLPDWHPILKQIGQNG